MASGYSYAQLEGFWINAGGSQASAPEAAAIALAESGGENIKQAGQPAATTGWGLWQITPGDPSLLNPQKNAEAAVAKWKAAGWQPWTTAQGGQELQFMRTGVKPDLSVSSKTTAGGSDSGSSSSSSSLLSSLTGGLNGVFNPIITKMAGVFECLGGGILMLVGIFVIMKNTQTGQAVQGSVTTGAMTAMKFVK